MPEGANENDWQQQLVDLEQKIQRLGAINLAAIEEFSAANERKEYLDLQYTDLTDALATLDDAIKKIDRETRNKFKETFDTLNERFTQFFPKIFGGGQAQLVMTGEDLLDTGVSVIARPPGKKNSTIQLLSGGEKALTAVALVFAIFSLNPAPFCILDEVDAPLDDNNVGRFCDLVKEMSQSIQFIYISHNKLAIGMAEQLQGVTMREPGVSRMVTVDIEAAQAMV
jgi:chromosome segregation protein